MKFSIFTFIVLFAVLVASCSQNLPEYYGIYAYTDEGKIILSGQKILFSGNVFNAITGLKGPSGIECNTIKNFIVFEKDINPKIIKISKLEFKKGGDVQNIFGDNFVDANLWVASKEIDFDIAPIEGKKDMYRLTPKEKLSEGFYALHFGGLGKISTIEASIGNMAYDFVIGNKNDYPTYEVMKRQNEENMQKEAGNLLELFNTYFNNKQCTNLKNIYRPNGRILNDSELHNFCRGQETWLQEAGRIIESKIVNGNISENESIFEIRTVYERRGQQNERLVVRKLDGKYYIIAIE